MSSPLMPGAFWLCSMQLLQAQGTLEAGVGLLEYLRRSVAELLKLAFSFLVLALAQQGVERYSPHSDLAWSRA